MWQRALAGGIALLGIVLLMAHPILYERSSAFWWGGGLFALVVCWALFTANKVHFSKSLLWAVGPLLATALLSLWLSEKWINSALMELLAYFFVLWASIWIAQDRVALRTVASALVLGCVLVCAYAFLQSRGLDPLPSGTPFDGRRIVATFENPNYLGNFAACVFPIVLAFFFAARRCYERLGVGAAVVLSYGACILAGSRGAWLAGVVGATVVLLGVYTGVRRGEIRLRWSSIAALLLAMMATTYAATRDPIIANAHGKISAGQRLFSALYLFAPQTKAQGDSIATTATSVQVGDVQVHDTTINHRYFIWQVAWAMVRDQPMTGVGYGEFAAHFPRYRDGMRDEEWYASLISSQQGENTRYAHNEYLHVWAECGVLGLLAFTWFIGRVGWTLMGCLRRGASLYAWGLIAGLGVMLVHSLVSYPLHLPLNGLMFWVCAGIALGQGEEGPLKG